MTAAELPVVALLVIRHGEQKRFTMNMRMRLAKCAAEARRPIAVAGGGS